MGVKALANSRPITVEFALYTSVDDAVVTRTVAVPVEGLQAVIDKIQQIEAAYAVNSSLANLSNKPVTVVGNNHYDTFVFNITTDLANGAYVAIYDYDNLPT